MRPSLTPAAGIGIGLMVLACVAGGGTTVSTTRTTMTVTTAVTGCQSGAEFGELLNGRITNWVGKLAFSSPRTTTMTEHRDSCQSHCVAKGTGCIGFEIHIYNKFGNLSSASADWGAGACANETDTCTCRGAVLLGRKYADKTEQPGSGALATPADMADGDHQELNFTVSTECSLAGFGIDDSSFLAGYDKACFCNPLVSIQQQCYLAGPPANGSALEVAKRAPADDAGKVYDGAMSEHDEAYYVMCSAASTQTKEATTTPSTGTHSAPGTTKTPAPAPASAKKSKVVVPIALTLAALALTGAGVAMYRKRDPKRGGHVKLKNGPSDDSYAGSGNSAAVEMGAAGTAGGSEYGE